MDEDIKGKKCSVVNCKRPVERNEYIVMDGEVFCERCAHLLLAEERDIFRIISLTKRLAELSEGEKLKSS